MVQTHFDAGNRALSAGDFAEAARLFREALAGAQFAPEIWNNLGIALFNSGGRREAVEVFRRAVQLNPQYSEAFYNLGRALAA